MSNAVWPVLPGLAWNVTRTPQWNTRVQKSVGGMELRASYYSQPIRRYQLTYDVLRATTALQELQSLAGFFHARQGSYDSFLYDDPTDDSVTSHGFGVGDGTTTTFQLQRTAAGPRNVDGISGTLAVPTTPRTNLLPYSADFTQAVWTKGFTTIGANAAEAPDGSLTADHLAETTGNGSHYVLQSLSGLADSVTVTASVFVKAAERTWVVLHSGDKTGQTYKSYFNLATGVWGTIATNHTVTALALAGGWYRLSWTFAVGTGASTPQIAIEIATGNGVFSYTGDGASGLYVWGGQSELGTVATPYIATTSAAVTANPAYWPAQGDGFEPLYNLKAGEAVYRNDWQGNQLLYRTARTNALFPSQDLTNASWAKETGVTITASQADPSGGTNAQQITTTTAGDGVYRDSGVAAASGTPWTFSVWLRAASAITVTLAIDRNGGFDLEQQNVNVTTAWQRFTFTHSGTWTGTSTVFAIIRPAAVGSVIAFGEQLEVGSVAGAYLATTTSAVTVTDYTLANGLVTFASAPRSGAALTWTGGYYWRCRFEKDLQEFNNFLYQLWEAKSVAFVTVKGS